MQTLTTKRQAFFKNPLLWITVLTVIVASALTVATWDINYWPTDTEDSYLGLAEKLSTLKYISQMHEVVDQEKVRWLHGKEMFIVAIAFFQRMFDDYKTLRPPVVMCIAAIGLSSIFVFLIARRYWGKGIGFLCFTIFITSFWPYVYILFAKHQPAGLFFFLLSLWILCLFKKQSLGQGVILAMSSACLCLSFYSSPASALYIPYYIAGFCYVFYKKSFEPKSMTKNLKRLLYQGIFVIIGFAVPFVYFNYPHIVRNISDYLAYSQISKSFGHFYYNQAALIQWVPHPELGVRGGWMWIIKYFLLIMPVLFPFYLLCLMYLLWRCFESRTNPRFLFFTGSVIALSLSSPFLAELRGVSQYGGNYFTSFVGIILLIGYALHDFLNEKIFWRLSALLQRTMVALGICLLAGHIIVNGYVFASDVYPTRMVTTFLSKKIEALGTQTVYSHRDNPYRRNIIGSLNPSLIKKLKFTRVSNIYQVPEGYIIVSPVSGSSIYTFIVPFSYNDYDKDIYLNELFRKGNIADYAVASFDTLSSSRIWVHEEEILTYRALILNHFKDIDKNRTKVWVLDAKKLQKDFSKNKPSQEYEMLVTKGVRNIGTKTRVYMFEGEMKQIAAPTILENTAFTVCKVGNPQDSLAAYVYKVKPDENIWIPAGENFMSNPVEGEGITGNEAGQSVVFQFKKPLTLAPGLCQIVVYRTGKEDDKNFYRVYSNNPALTASFLKASKIPQNYLQN